MSWKKNPVSYVCWFLYAILTGTALLCLSGYISEVMRLDWYWAIIFALLYVLCAAVLVVLIHRISIETSAYFGGRRVLEGLSKAILLTILATIGLYLRLRIIDGVENITDQLAQTIMVELVLQMAAAFLLFFVLNKLSGYFCGLISFGFMMCSPRIVQQMDDNSMEMLSLLILLTIFGVSVIGYKKKLYPALYFFYGAMAAFVSCLDIMGVLLLCMVLAFVFVNREQGAGVGRKIAALLCGIAGYAAGLCGCLFVESLLSNRAFDTLFVDLMLKYQPKAFQLPLTIEQGDFFTEVCVLVGMMVFGIFGFWYDRNQERIGFATLLLCGLIALKCFGMDGELLSGSFMIYLLMVVLAGVGVQQCICGLCVPGEILLPEEINEEMLQEEIPEYVIEPLSQDMAVGVVLQDSAADASSQDMTVDAVMQNPGIADVLPVLEPSVEEVSGGEILAEMEAVAEPNPIQFIENPLPLPKKHEKRVMDYDIEVSDDDDYDLK